VHAQAAFLCWHNVEIRANLFALCEAIRTGKPTTHHYHCQITADRWNEMHVYLAGVQRWLGVKHPLPPQVDPHKVGEIGRWLGERTPAKEALAKLLLIRLVDDLLNYVSLTQFERNYLTEHEVYSDFSVWYLASDGTPYAVARVDDSSRQPFADPRLKDRVDQLEDVVRESLSSCPADAEQLISSIKRQTQPPCMHRFSRYLDVQIASIGACKWRGNLPAETVPKAEWHAFTEQALAALNAWVNDTPAESAIGQPIYASLGEPTVLKRAIVRDFGLFGFWDIGDGPGWDWLVYGAQTEGTNAYTAFHLEHVFGPAVAPNQV
jgi:hypothetical protein